MLLNNAIFAAKLVAIKDGISMVVVHAPLQRKEWETEAEAYGYGPVEGYRTLFPGATLVGAIGLNGIYFRRPECKGKTPA